MKDTSGEITKTMTETSIKNNDVLENLNDKLSEITKDRGILGTYLMFPLSIIADPEHTSQFKKVKYPDSDKVNDLLTNKTKPVTLCNNLLKFRDTEKKFELHGDLLKMMTSKTII